MSNDAEPTSDDASGRRTFIKRVAMTGAFAAPIVSSFTMSGLVTPASAGASNMSGFASNQQL